MQQFVCPLWHWQNKPVSIIIALSVFPPVGWISKFYVFSIINIKKSTLQTYSESTLKWREFLKTIRTIEHSPVQAPCLNSYPLWHLQHNRIRITGVMSSNLCFNKPCRWFWCTLKFENPYLKVGKNEVSDYWEHEKGQDKYLSSRSFKFSLRWLRLCVWRGEGGI